MLSVLTTLYYRVSPFCQSVRMCMCMILYQSDLMLEQVHCYKNVVCKLTHLWGYAHKHCLQKRNTCCGLHNKPSNAPVQPDYTSPVCVCVYETNVGCGGCKRRFLLAGVGQKSVSSAKAPCIVWDLCVILWGNAHKMTTHTDTQFGLKIEKVGAHEGNKTGHGHFCCVGSYTPQPFLLSVTCWIVRGWNSFDSARHIHWQKRGLWYNECVFTCMQISVCVLGRVSVYKQHVGELLVLSAVHSEHSVTAAVWEYLTMLNWYFWKELLSLMMLSGSWTLCTHGAQFLKAGDWPRHS